MDGLAKLVIRLGSKAVTLIALIVSCLAAAATLFWQHQQLSEQVLSTEKAGQVRTARLLQAYTQAKVEDIQAIMAKVAASPLVATALKNQDPSLIELQQQDILTYIPFARQVCLIDAAVDDVTEHGCMPVTFALLNSLRMAKKTGNAPVAVVNPGKKNAHLLLAQRIVSRSKQVVGVLVVTLKPDIVGSMIYQLPDFKGYVELQQGRKKMITLAAKGETAAKQGAASYLEPIAGTYWRLAYWPRPFVSPSLPVWLIGLVVAVIVLMWLLRDAVKAYLLSRDVTIVRLGLADLREGTLKPRYAVSLTPMNKVIKDIIELGRAQYHQSAKPGATAESVDQKMIDLGQAPRKAADVHDEQEIATVEPEIFKTYDVRGVVGKNLDEATVKVIGQAIGSEALAQNINQLVVARDGRLSSDSLCTALSEGITASGCDVIDIGEVPTPLMYFACEELQTQSGVMVTGSHNPPEYNGLKIMLAGQNVAGEALQRIYQRIEKGDLRTGDGQQSQSEIVDIYIRRIQSDIRLFRPMKVVIDCGNGVTGGMAPELFRALGCDVIELNCEVDGTFPNHHPDPGQPENMKDLATAVKQHDAELGLAFDGDGDRLGVVDANGNIIWPDRLLILFAQDILSRLPGSVVVYDVKCTSLLGEEIANAGGEPVMTQSGYVWIKQAMQEKEAQLGGELSGHIFIQERWYGFDDAMYAAARLLELISGDLMQRQATGMFNSLPDKIATPEILIEMDEQETEHFVRRLAAEGEFDGAELITIDGVRAEYIYGWGLVRASHTMPAISVRFEADTVENLHKLQQHFKQQMIQIKPTLKFDF